MEEAHTHAVERIYGITKLALSGKIPTKEFRRQNHPLGRGPSAQYSAKRVKRSLSIPPFPINEQTGRLKRSLSMNQVAPNVYHIGLSASYARYVLGVGGTRKMVDRQFYGPNGNVTKAWKALQHGIRLAIRKGNIT